MRIALILFVLYGLVVGQVLAREKAEPIIKTVRVEPLLFCAATGLTIEPVLSEGKGSYDYEYKWFKNGEELFFENSSQLSGDLIKRDDLISVEVTPVDGKGVRYNPFVSLPLKAVNSSPSITSEPPNEFGAKGIYYRVEASDPDDDEISYSLEGDLPSDMSINTISGELLWEFETMPVGLFKVTIVAKDGHGGRAEQVLELDLSYVEKRRQ